MLPGYAWLPGSNDPIADHFEVSFFTFSHFFAPSTRLAQGIFLDFSTHRSEVQGAYVDNARGWDGTYGAPCAVDWDGDGPSDWILKSFFVGTFK